MRSLLQVDKILGVDQSMNCTGVCLHTIETVIEGENTKEYHSYEYWLIPSDKKMTKKMREFKHPRVHIIEYPKQIGTDYVTKEVAKTFNIYKIVDVITEIVKKKKPSMLCMEGISYGSAGSAALVDLAGLNYCIRMMAINKSLAINIVAPTELKKKATGNGGADKDEMVWAWKQCDKNIANINDIKIDDLADAFFLSKCLPNKQD